MKMQKEQIGITNPNDMCFSGGTYGSSFWTCFVALVLIRILELKMNNVELPDNREGSLSGQACSFSSFKNSRCLKRFIHMRLRHLPGLSAAKLRLPRQTGSCQGISSRVRSSLGSGSFAYLRRRNTRANDMTSSGNRYEPL
jgi:hypothetical protein